uniref:Uncharacterized protein n=1 Tax=Arundo donax TaxID=35708 RepID=A0A0A8YU75_ARUDO
MIVRGTEYN